MATDTYKLSLKQRNDLKTALMEKHKSLKKCIKALAEVRLADSNASVLANLLESVGTQIRRILRSNDKHERNGVLTAEWKEDLAKVLDNGEAVIDDILSQGGGDEIPEPVTKPMRPPRRRPPKRSELTPPPVPLATVERPSDLEKIVKPIVIQCVAKEIREKITPLILSALSRDRERRRQIHTTMRCAPKSVRSSFLKCMFDLTKSSAERVRGEAYYCVGDIRLHPDKPTVTEGFLKSGLKDKSLFVQACCANVLARFCPLSTSTVSVLEAMSIDIPEGALSPDKKKLLYYVTKTLEINAATKNP